MKNIIFLTALFVLSLSGAARADRQGWTPPGQSSERGQDNVTHRNLFNESDSVRSIKPAAGGDFENEIVTSKPRSGGGDSLSRALTEPATNGRGHLSSPFDPR